MADINEQYYQKHLKFLASLSRRIRRLYEAVILDIAFTASVTPIKADKFSLSLYPALEKEVQKAINSLHGDIYSTLISGINQSWNLSNEKNDLIVDKRLADKRPSKRARQILYDPNKGALDAFIKRKEKGLDLSKRVWKTLEPFKHEIEQGLGIGISEGRSAKKIAAQLKANLNEPERLFRRVRGEDGKLRLSAAARNYHPGRGVYRSSHQNAMRLARSENNMAYQNADYERWQTLPFVIGIEVLTSKNHPVRDICDYLAGRYPPDYRFRQWHPQCICHARPILMSDEQYDKYEDQILGIGKIDMRTVPKVRTIPATAKKWIEDHREQMDGWKSKPYFIRDNAKYIK